MNKRNKQRKQETQKRKRKALMHQKKLDKETFLLENESRKMQAKQFIDQIVKDDSEKERNRIALSMLPREKQEIQDVKEYRKQRKKRLRA